MKLKYILIFLFCFSSNLIFGQKERVTSIYLKHNNLNTSLIEERSYDHQYRLVRVVKYHYNSYGQNCLDSAYYHETTTYEYDVNGELVNESKYHGDKLYRQIVKLNDHNSSITKRINYFTERESKNGKIVNTPKTNTAILEWVKFEKGKITEKRVYPDPDNSTRYLQENWTYKGPRLQQYTIQNQLSDGIFKSDYLISSNEKMTINYRVDRDSMPERIEISHQYDEADPHINSIEHFDLEGRLVEKEEFGRYLSYTTHERYYYEKDRYGYSNRTFRIMDEQIDDMSCGDIEVGHKPSDYEWIIYNIDTSYSIINREKNFDYPVFEHSKYYTIGYKDPEESFSYIYKNKDSILFSNTILREEKQEYDKEKKVLRLITYGQETDNSCKHSYGKILETVIDSLKKTKTRIIYHNPEYDKRHLIETKYILDWSTEKDIRKEEYSPFTGKINLITVYGYNKNGELISEKDSIATNQKRRTVQHEYMAGRLKSSKTNIKDKSDILEQFEYAPDGSLKKSEKITTYKKDGEQYGDFTIYEPDGSYTKIYISHLQRPSHERDSSVVKYNTKLKVVEERKYSKTILFRGYFDEYNERGQLTRSYNEEKDMDIHLIYNKAGRLVQKKIYRTGDAVDLIKKKINNTDNPYLLRSDEVYIYNFSPAIMETYKHFSVNKKKD
ncbi:MAG: hypothetical protein J7604_26010 [Sporocytophaga sp.]|uniref:hypothetical protein n=1 Tax=Sporocytophaga sp. TaxID=2231183 RepID=UPI001B156B60|nr:hypothetical protein [Sporocytophaga sp.]MBO9703687.1 hypothetical protein [Sporocytophaga sp.]